MSTRPLILASRSAARRMVLEGAGVPFEAEDAGVDETAEKDRLLAEGATPLSVAVALAGEKAMAVSRRRPGRLVLGSDQTLDLEGRLIDKAPDMASARARLIELRGRTHALRNGTALALDGALVWSGHASATLHVRDFSDAFLDSYLVAEGEALLGSVGCYRLEGLGAQLFSGIEGDYFTILGLPLWPLLDELRARGVIAA